MIAPSRSVRSLYISKCVSLAGKYAGDTTGRLEFMLAKSTHQASSRASEDMEGGRHRDACTE